MSAPNTPPSKEVAEHVAGNATAAMVEKPLLALLGKYKGQIEQILPKQFDSKRALKLIVGAINQNPKLLQCTPISVINAVLTAATLGLEIRPNSAYLIPFSKRMQDARGNWDNRYECTLVIDYRGKIDLVTRNGDVIDIDPDIVWSKDKFRIYRDPDSGLKRVEHEPVYYNTLPDGSRTPVTEDDRGVPLGALVVAVMKEGKPKVLFMPRVEIMAIKNRSKAKDNGPWVTDELEMWKKTAIHRICKTLPQSPELDMSQRLDDAVDTGVRMDVIDVLPEDDTDFPLVQQSQASADAVADKKIAEAEAAAEKARAKVSKPVEVPADKVRAPDAPVNPGTPAFNSWEEVPDPMDPALGLRIVVGGVVKSRPDVTEGWTSLPMAEPTAKAQPRSVPVFGRKPQA